MTAVWTVSPIIWSLHVVLAEGQHERKTTLKRKKEKKDLQEDVIKGCYILKIDHRDHRDLHIRKPE